MDNNELSDELSLQSALDDSILSVLFPKLDDIEHVELNPLLKKNDKRASIYIKAKDLAQGRDQYMLDEAGRKNAIEIGLKVSF